MIVPFFRKLIDTSPNLAKHKRSLLLAVFLTCVFLSCFRIAHAQTQPESPSYWQYAASGRIVHVEPADVDADGVDEFLIADENGRVELISAYGRQLWTHTATEPILTVKAINIHHCRW